MPHSVLRWSQLAQIRTRSRMSTIHFTLNGKSTIASYEPGMHFLEVLREECGILSPKDGCSPEGSCGCCAILVDGQPVLACRRKPEHIEGHEVVTLEGIPEQMRSVLGEAFVLEGGVQCGFCIPGIVVRASSLLRKGTTGDREAVAQALSGHLCRCTGYARIIDAIQTAGEAWNNGKHITRTEPRRHFFFGEEFGRQTKHVRIQDCRWRGHVALALLRNRAGVGRAAFHRRHARSGNAARSARVERAPAGQGAGDRYLRRCGLARRGEDSHCPRCPGQPRHRSQHSRFARLRSHRRNHLRRRRCAGPGGRRHRLPCTPGRAKSRSWTTKCTLP